MSSVRNTGGRTDMRSGTRRPSRNGVGEHFVVRNEGSHVVDQGGDCV
jgi:hypothetical protein